MEFIYYKEFSKERKEMRELWNAITSKNKLDWEDFIETAERIKQASE